MHWLRHCDWLEANALGFLKTTVVAAKLGKEGQAKIKQKLSRNQAVVLLTFVLCFVIIGVYTTQRRLKIKDKKFLKIFAHVNCFKCFKYFKCFN